MRWEYQSVEFGSAVPTNAELNTYGVDGWELVACVYRFEDAHYYGAFHCLFKRPIVASEVTT